MLKLAEDRESGGLFTNWFGKKSKYGLEFRLSTRLLATFLLYQVHIACFFACVKRDISGTLVSLSHELFGVAFSTSFLPG